MKRLFILAVLVASPALAQTAKEPKNLDEAKAEIKQMTEALAEAKLALYTARMNVVQCQANPILSDRQNAIKEIEALHPGKHWDDRIGALVDTPPAPPVPQAPPQPAQPAQPEPKK
jgi:NAD(P)-dependent dehydrogenase (short-subunit alcohol dehydrogenase family)